MIDKPSREQLDKEVRQLRKDLKKLGEEIEMRIEIIGKRDIKDMTPEELGALLVKAPFTLSSPLKDHYKIGEIEDLVDSMKTEIQSK